MPPEGDEEGHAVADAVATDGHGRQATRETDADDADAAVCGQLGLRRHPQDGVLDEVGGVRGDAELLQVGRRHCDDPEPGLDEIPGESHEPLFLDAVTVDAWHKDNRALGGRRRMIKPRGHRAPPRGNGQRVLRPLTG